MEDAYEKFYMDGSKSDAEKMRAFNEGMKQMPPNQFESEQEKTEF